MPANRPNCVFLDKLSIDCNDLDFSAISSSTNLSVFDRSGNEDVITRSTDAEIIITNKVKLERQHIEQLPKLKLICVTATGTNNIDFDAATDHNITVCNVKDYAAASVSQHVFLLILALTGNFLSYQKDISKGKWQAQDQFCLLTYPIQALQGKTIGLVGYGHIAKAVERVASAFGMTTLISRSVNPASKDKIQPGRIALDDLLKQADIISLHCPLTESTLNLISARELALMKSTAFIINAARGGIINEADLLEALQTDQIAGAGLDCLVQEPPSADDPLLNADLTQLVITPHNAWGTHLARQKLVDGTTTNIQNYISGNLHC